MSEHYDPQNILNSEGCVYVRVEVYADLLTENARLKSEVETFTSYLKWNGITADFESWQDWKSEKTDRHINESRKSYAALEAEVERLRKAGDDLAEHAINREFLCYDSIYESRDYVDIPEVKCWNAAKEVQS